MLLKLPCKHYKTLVLNKHINWRILCNELSLLIQVLKNVFNERICSYSLNNMW